MPSSPAANLLTGLGVDEYFTRTDASGARAFLADALGSTLALADSTGSVQTQYTYEPFGTTTASGPASTSLFQYTGRENDGTGLYYYRARYYHPGLQRFIAEDPINFEGGDLNLYEYVGNSPLGWIDPEGLSATNSAECRNRDCPREWLNCYTWENLFTALGGGGVLGAGGQVLNKTAQKPRGGVAGGGPSGRYTSWTRRVLGPPGRAIGRIPVGTAGIIGAGGGALVLHGYCLGTYLSCLQDHRAPSE